MAKLDIPYSKSTLTYPATLKQIAENACSTAGVVLVGGDFLNSGYSVAKRPADEKRTCREILSYVAQLAGCFARCSRTGEIEIKWYMEPSSLWNVGYKASSVTTGIFDTEITGVDVTGNDDKKTIYKSGTEDYAISISDNPLVQNNPQTFADSLGAKFIGMKFRTYSSTSLSNPAVEAGDIVNLTDAKGNTTENSTALMRNRPRQSISSAVPYPHRYFKRRMRKRKNKYRHTTKRSSSFRNS